MNPGLGEIDKSILQVSIINIPATLLVGFGLLGKYGEPEDLAAFPYLADATLTTGMIIIAAPIMIWAGVTVVRLLMEKARIQRGEA